MPSLLGKAQVGLTATPYYGLLMPFINQWKCGGDIQVIANGVNYWSFTPPGNAFTPWGVHIDENGEMINPQPAGTTHLVRIIYAQPVDGIPDGYPSRTGQSWVLKWDGDSALTVSVPLNSIVRSGARLTGTWTDDTSNKSITFSNFSLTDPPRNIRFLRADYEALLDQGEIFSSDFASDIQRGSGIVRFMNWADTNDNRVGLSYNSLPLEPYYSWGSGISSAITGIKQATPLSVLCKFANKVYSHPWFCIPSPFGVEKFWRIGAQTTVTITIASPGVVTWPNHPFPASAGVVFTTSGALPTGLVAGTTYYVVGASIAADTFQVSATPGGAAINTSGTQSGTHTGTAEAISRANPPLVISPGHTFVNGDQVIAYRLSGMLKSATVTTTIASPCVVTWTSHGLIAGSNVTFSGGTLPTGITAGQSYYVIAAGLTADAFQIAKTPGGAAINTSGSQSGTHTGTAQINRNKFTVQNAVAEKSFELATTDATTYSAYTYSTSAPGWFMSPVSLSRLTSDVTPYATYVRDNINPALTPRFEFSNEMWNAIFDVFHQLAAQAHNLLDGSDNVVFTGDDATRMSGYLSAHIMKAVRDVYGVANRTRWKGIVPSQTVNTGVTTAIIAGIDRYIADQAPTLTINDLFDDGAITGYYGGNHTGNSSPGSVTIDVPTSVFTRNNHGFVDRRPVEIAGTLPSPLIADTIYYTRDTTTNTFKLATTPGGTAITLTGSVGSNTVTLVMGDWSLEVINTSISRFNSGLERTRYSYYNQIMNEDNTDSRWSGYPFSLSKIEVFIAAQKALFDARGLGTTQYEGGFATDITAFIGSPDFNLYNEFFPIGAYSGGNADIHYAMCINFEASGGTFPSKYVDFSPATRFGAFGGQQFVGNPNPVWEAVCKFNDKIWCGRLR